MSNILRLETCTECDKKFVPAVGHVYKVTGIGNQCSYSCCNKAKERLDERKRKAALSKMRKKAEKSASEGTRNG